MGLYYADGPWTYRSTQGGTLVITSTERLLSLRVFAAGTSASFTIDGPGFSGESIPISSNVGFDWTPSGKITNSTLTFSSTALQFFAELEILVGQ